MKIFYIATILVWFSIVANGQSPNWEWAKNTRGTKVSGSEGLSYSANGYIYVTGYFSGVITFGSDTLTNGVSLNIFIVKYDSLGNVIWAKSAGESDGASGFGITVDINGYIYVTGTFDNLPITFGNDTLKGGGMFIVKYNSVGNVIWAKGGGNNFGERIITDAYNNIYVTGGYTDTNTFGNDILIGGGMFVAKYDSLGNVIWARSGENANAGGTGVATDAEGNIYVTGSFTPKIIFGNDTLTNTGTNFFIVKYNLSGDLIWAKGASGSSMGNGLTTDINDNIYVTGDFGDSIVLDNDTLIGTGIFVAKYDPSGNVIWVKSAIGRSNAFSVSVITDASSNVYITGYFIDTVIVFGNDTLMNNGRANVFVAKLGTTPATGIISVPNTNSLMTVYPNPTTGTIYFSGVQTGYTLQVYNVLGQMISSSMVDRDNYAINLSGKAKGMYFYRVADGAVLVGQGKVVVE